MKKFKWMIASTVVLLLTTVFGMTASVSDTGNVAGVVEDTWRVASSQIKTVVNNVVFPATDLVLAVLSFIKAATTYMSYRKHGQTGWAPATILFAELVLSLFAPMYVWQIAGIQEVK